ncbi:MAG: PH domain-containing protein [Thermoplasmata archaeon]|nr:PH domain-containing protein [Thermoplasmata archaeon]
MKDGMKIGLGIGLSMAIVILGTFLLIAFNLPMAAYWALLAVSVVTTLVPFMLLKGDWVVLTDEGVRIEAPLAKLFIPYESIESIQMVQDFEPGTRVFGYGGIHRGSGEFSNKELGSYTLAGTTAINRMIVVRYTVGGRERVAAFNDFSETETLEDYRTLEAILGPDADSYVLNPERQEEAARSHRSTNRSVGIIVTLSVFVAIILVAVGMSIGSVSASIDGDKLVIDATMMDETVDLDDIVYIELRSDVDYGDRIAGLANSTCLTGDYRSDDYGDYRLAVYKNVSRCIVVHTTSGVIVFNLQSDAATEAFYQELSRAINSVIPELPNLGPLGSAAGA